MAGRAQVYWVKRIDNSRLLRQRHRTRARDCGRLLALAAVFLAAGLLLAWQHFRSLDYGYRVEELRAQWEEAREWNRALRLEQASLRDPMRIDQFARARLGLEAPLAGQWIPLGRPSSAKSEPFLAQRLPRPEPGRGPAYRRVSVAD